MIIGVTGTDGKTTTVNMIYKILKDAGKKTSMISTINAVIGEKSYDTGFHVTSPHPFDVQQYIKNAANAGSEFMVLEVTSHALDQYRFWGTVFKVGVITNITHEHLDYHKTYQNYLKAKLKLLKNTEKAVVNSNLNEVPEINDLGKNKITTFGLENGDFNQKELQIKLGLSGEYNIENALAALAVISFFGIDIGKAKKSLQSLPNLSGRMEKVENSKGIKVIIDFAHTPNGIRSALETLRKETRGKLIAVFGSAGKRDVEKRQLMGEIVGKLADIAVVTAEDPRGELEEINQQIKVGLKKSGGVENTSYFIINDRQQAIEFAVNSAKRGDLIGIFGKGHETTLNIDGKIEVPWSEHKAAQKALR